MLFAVMLIGLTAIFLHAMKYGEKTWLDLLLEFITVFWNSTALSSIMLSIIVIAAMLFVTWDKGTSQPAPKQ